MNTKSLLIAALAAFSLFNASAQEFKSASGSLQAATPFGQLQPAAASASFAPAASSDRIYWGYCGDEVVDGIGLQGQTAEIGAAIFVPGEALAAFEGCKIEAVSIGMYQPCTKGKILFMSSVKPETATYSQEVGDMSEGWVDYELDEPQTIDGNDFYVGYKATGQFVAGVSAVSHPNGIFLCAGGQWDDMSGQFAASICIRLVISAEGAVEREMSLLSVDDLLVAADAPYMVKGTVKNETATPVSSYEITCTVDGQALVKQEFQTNLAFGKTEKFEVEMPALAETGEYAVTVAISAVNGEADADLSNNAAEKALVCADAVYPRVVVLEEGTGTWCGWCPRGIVGVREMKKKYPERFIGIAVHSGDAMECAAYSQIFPAYGIESFPAGIVNRYYSTDPGFEGLEYCMNAIPEMTTMKIDVEAAFTEGQDEIEVTTETMFGLSVDQTSAQIAVALLENGVTGYRQQNYYAGGANGPMGGFESMGSSVAIEMNEVARGIWDSWQGISESVPASVESGMPYEFKYTIPASELKKAKIKNKANLEIVALLLDTKTGEIKNAASAKVTGGEASVGTVKAETLVYAENGKIRANSENAVIEVWNLAGALLPNENLPSGVYIVKVTDENGTVIRKIGM